ncbi:ATP-binding protein [Lachnospiraceae bacterium 42-17]|jgi:signal transduction histidine kinase/ActR/RegA family two-component response regulator|nr:response regulator [Dorea sp.]
MEERAINREEEQAGLLTAIENTDICSFWYFPQERLITINERTARMYSCKREYADMPVSFAEDFVHPSTRAVFYEMYHKIDSGENSAHASFSSIDRKNWCTVTLTTVSRDEQGRPIKSYGVIQNISEMKLQEAEYHSSRRTLSSIINALSKIYMFNYYIDLTTGKFKEIVGLDYITSILGARGDAAYAFQQFTETLIEESYKKVFEDFVNLNTLAERIGNWQNISLEYLSIRRGWCRASFIVVNRNPAGVPVQVGFVVENISAERKKELEAKKTLERAYETANRANASKSAFLSNMSHDIRTPMNAIVGFAAIAASHLDDRERVADCISKITASSKHLLSIINEVLDMSRIESGKIQLQEQQVRLSGVLKDFMNMIQEQARAKDLKLCLEMDSPLHENVYVDEAKLHRVLLNLVGNAVKFTPAGGEIFIRLMEKPQENPEYGRYVISVRDTGIGMSSEFLPHVFEPFEREETSTVSRVEGTGLGMPITKNIVEMMGGTICAESEQGKGSTFIIELPLKLWEGRGEQDSSEEILTEWEILEKSKEVVQGKRILLAEDNELNQEIAVDILTEAGFLVDTVNDGKEAVETIAAAGEGDYDLILMDIQMPVMDGYEAAEAIREMTEGRLRRLPILAMTANAFDEDRKKALEAGMDGHLAKPIDVGVLFRTLYEILK